MSRIPWHKVPGQFKITQDFLEVKDDCPHMEHPELKVVAFGDPMAGGVLFCPFCREYVGTWDIQGYDWEKKYLAEIAEFRYALADLMIKKFATASVEELFDYVEYVSYMKAEDEFDITKWLSDQLGVHHPEWQDSQGNFEN